MARWILALLLASGAFGGRAPGSPSPQNACWGIAEAAERTVIFNTKSRIYHHAGCNAARACTVNCVSVPISEALRRGGRACGRCGG
jgi:hypothetical protein